MEPTVTMTGRVGHMPELRTSRSGAPYTRFRIAHTPRLQRDGQWVDGETSWVTVLCHRDLAVNVATCLRKGDPVVVSGRARVESWVDDETKALRESLTVEARTVGHDLCLGETRFTRIRHDHPADEAGEVGGPRPESAEEATSEATGDPAGVAVDHAVPDTAAELLAPAPF